MGVVYLAVDPSLSREVAIKVLPESVARDPERLVRFEREAKLLAALNHPNIATIYSLERATDGAPLVVLEYIAGSSLAERLRDGEMSINESVRIATEVARALDAAHRRGVIHRDLKPENVRLTSDGDVKVLDFGLARMLEAPLEPPIWSVNDGREDAGATASLTAGVAGTPGYMSPEQAHGEPQDQRTDLFAFGCLFYECLAGGMAFGGSSVAERLEALERCDPDWSVLPEMTPEAARELLGRCLSRTPEDRPRDFREVLLVLLDPGEAVAVPARSLPREMTSLIGREHEVEEVRALLGQRPLVTLHGAGGCGKTRLALHLAHLVGTSFSDGVYWIELAQVRDGAELPLAVLSALGEKERPGRDPTVSIADFFRRRDAVLVLDNAEHVQAATTQLVEALLRRAISLRILVTSRSSLHLSGEAVVPISPLAVPPSRARIDQIASYPAVVLFVERARAARPAFELTPSDAASVAEIVRRLDGIPLALELAASRVSMLSIEQIRDKLDDRLRLLGVPALGESGRRQTLRAAIAWSYDLLTEDEKGWLRRLSVFAGGFLLESATAVCGEGGDEFDTLELLTRLTDRSLLVATPDDPEPPRYRLLESIRHFAREELERTPGARAVRRRHRDHFLALCEAAWPDFGGPRQPAWIERLRRDEENLLEAIVGADALGDGVEPIQRLAYALRPFWLHQGEYSRAIAAFERCLEADSTLAPTIARARVLAALGNLRYLTGDVGRARNLLEDGLTLYRNLGSALGSGYCLLQLACVAVKSGELDRAEALAHESLAEYERSPEGSGHSGPHTLLGNLAMGSGDLARAREAYEAALAVQRRVGDRHNLATGLINLGSVFLSSGELERAAELFEEGLRLYESMRIHSVNVADCLANLGEVHFRRGHLADARARITEAVDLFREFGMNSKRRVSLLQLAQITLQDGDQPAAILVTREALNGCDPDSVPPLGAELIAAFAAARGEAEVAARSAGHADARRVASHDPRDAWGEQWFEGRLALVRASFGAEAFDETRRLAASHPAATPVDARPFLGPTAAPGSDSAAGS